MLITFLIILSGLLIGVVVAAPVGPVNVLCIQRTLHRGFWGGVASGMGAVLGDGILAATAALSVKEASGFNSVSSFIDTHSYEIEIIGGLIIIILGVRLYLKKPVLSGAMDDQSKLSRNAGAIPQSFFMTITNPAALFSIFALFAMLVSSIKSFDSFTTFTLDSLSAFILVIAVMAGSAAWWCGLAWMISEIRHHVSEKRLRRINQIAAAILVCFGVVFIIKGSFESLT